MAQLTEDQRNNAIEAIRERLKMESGGISKETAIEEAEAATHEDLDGRSVEGLIKAAGGKKYKNLYYHPDNLPEKIAPDKTSQIEQIPFLDVSGELHVTVKGEDFTVEADVKRAVLYRKAK